MFCAQDGGNLSFLAQSGASRLFIELPNQSRNAAGAIAPSASKDRSPKTGRIHVDQSIPQENV